MGSVTHSFLKFFRAGAMTHAAQLRRGQSRVRRHSTAFKEFIRTIAKQESVCIFDLGATSATNIGLLTDRGYGVYTEDLLGASADPSLMIEVEDGSSTLDVPRFLRENVAYQPQIFDAVLLWDIADYLPEVLVKPVIERICGLMKPGGMLLAFFHTRDAGPEASYSRYHIVGEDELELQPILRGGSFVRLQRVFNNRHIENLFRDYSSLKFFLARDNMREVLVIR